MPLTWRAGQVAMTEWYLVRHGQTDWNAGSRIQGQTDIPLNDHGRGQARANGERFAALWRHEGEPHMVVSPLGRTRETADLFRAAAGMSAGRYETDERLKEISFGDWEGRTLVDVWYETPDPVEARKKDKWGYVVPGGESYAVLQARTVPVLDTLPERAVVVSHGGTMRTLIQHLTGADPAEMAEMEVPQDRIWRWDGANGEWV